MAQVLSGINFELYLSHFNDVIIASCYIYANSIAAIRLCAVPSFIALRNSINFINLTFAGNNAENPA